MLCLAWTPANSCLGLDSSAPVPGSDSPQSLFWKMDMTDLIRHVGTLLQCIFCWLLGRGKKIEGQHLARHSQRVCGHGEYTHGAQVEETSHAPFGSRWEAWHSPAGPPTTEPLVPERSMYDAYSPPGVTSRASRSPLWLTHA